MSVQLHLTRRRLALSCVSIALSAMTAIGLVQPASAVTELDPFAGLVVTQSGCASAVVTAAPGTTGARFYRSGRRVTVPSVALQYDRFGLVVLQAKAKTGYLLDRTRYEITAPVDCFTAITLYDPADEVIEGVNSWCDKDPNPVVSASISGPGARYPLPAHWKLVRLKTGRVLAAGAFGAFSFDSVPSALPTGLPYGKYRIIMRIDEQPKTLFPVSYRVEHYRCVNPVAKPGRVVFRAPAGGPDVELTLYNVHAPDDDLPTYVTIKAGHRYVLSTTLPAIDWSARPIGNHVGTMGSGEVTVPKPHS